MMGMILTSFMFIILFMLFMLFIDLTFDFDWQFGTYVFAAAVVFVVLTVSSCDDNEPDTTSEAAIEQQIRQLVGELKTEVKQVQQDITEEIKQINEDVTLAIVVSLCVFGAMVIIVDSLWISAAVSAFVGVITIVFAMMIDGSMAVTSTPSSTNPQILKSVDTNRYNEMTHNRTIICMCKTQNMLSGSSQ